MGSPGITGTAGSLSDECIYKQKSKLSLLSYMMNAMNKRLGKKTSMYIKKYKTSNQIIRPKLTAYHTYRMVMSIRLHESIRYATLTHAKTNQDSSLLQALE